MSSFLIDVGTSGGFQEAFWNYSAPFTLGNFRLFYIFTLSDKWMRLVEAASGIAVYAVNEYEMGLNDICAWTRI